MRFLPIRFLLGTLFTLLVVGFLAVGAFLITVDTAFHTPVPLEEPLVYEIKPGATLASLFRDLSARGLVAHPMLYQYGLRIKGMDGKVKTGEYQITPDDSPRNIMALFSSGPNYQRYVTFREGLTSYEIVQLLNAANPLAGEITDIPAEGTLLPETYSYSKEEDRAAIIARMQTALTKVLDDAWETRAEGLPLQSKEEALVLASIIEKETAVADERKRVAGVFINRLRKGMLLQTDPTVIYGITGGKHEDKGKGPLGRRLLTKDLAFESPYNTYLHAGLPPGPIANAGAASIEAALHPEEHHYLYFVADGTGGHVFSKTLEEHNANVAKWRKIRQSTR